MIVAEGIALPFKAVAMVSELGRTRLDVTVRVRERHTHQHECKWHVGVGLCVRGCRVQVCAWV